MAATIPGMKNIWLKTIKVQGQTREGEKPYDAAFVMESPTRPRSKPTPTTRSTRPGKIYVPIRAESRSHDIGN